MRGVEYAKEVAGRRSIANARRQWICNGDAARSGRQICKVVSASGRWVERRDGCWLLGVGRYIGAKEFAVQRALSAMTQSVALN
jgi:hypothetical protein